MVFQALQAGTGEVPDYQYFPKDDLSEYHQFNQLANQPDLDELDQQFLKDLRGEE